MPAGARARSLSRPFGLNFVCAPRSACFKGRKTPLQLTVNCSQITNLRLTVYRSRFTPPAVGGWLGRRRPTGLGLFPTVLAHFHHPWRSDVGRYDSREGGGRVAPGAATESNAGSSCRDVQVPRNTRLHGKDCSYNPIAFPPSLVVRWRRYDCRDAGVRATQGAVAESRVGNSGRGRARAAMHSG